MRSRYAIRLSATKCTRSIILASAVIAGALAPDLLDHILIKNSFQYSYGKGWAHSILGCLVILCFLSGAYMLRHYTKRLVLRDR